MAGQEWWPDGAPVVGDALAGDLAAKAAPTITTGFEQLLKGHGMHAADRLLNDACREAIAAYKLARRVGRVIPLATVEERLWIAAEEAATVLPDTPAHLGATWENKW